MARTRAADFKEKQRHILQSAAAVFAELGMEKASMAQIASHSQVSKALLYHYYPSKEVLIFDIIHTHLCELEAAVTAADRADMEPEERLRLLVRQVLDSYRDADNQHQIQLNGMRALSQEQTDAIRIIERRIVKRFSTVLLMINPDINRNRPLLMPVAMSLFGMMNWVYTWFRPDGPISRDQYADLATTLILNGFKNLR